MNRVTFLIDGFNLYHSVRKASKHLNGASTKWLDIRALCSSYLYIIGGGAQLEEIHYFSALARHLEAVNPDVTRRHVEFLECLRGTGIQDELGRFKRKDVWCPHCNQTFIRHEEKETDVAIAVKLMELLHTGACETVVLVTGDTDLAPAVRTAQRLFPASSVLFAFPYFRKNKELAKLAPRSFEIKKEHYAKYQLPDPVVLPDGRMFSKPADW